MAGTIPYDPFNSNSPMGDVVYPYDNKIQFGSRLSPQYMVTSPGGNVQMRGVNLPESMDTSRSASPQPLSLLPPVVLPQALPQALIVPSPVPPPQGSLISQALPQAFPPPQGSLVPLASPPRWPSSVVLPSTPVVYPPARSPPLRFTPVLPQGGKGSTDPWDVFAVGDSPPEIKSPVVAQLAAPSTPQYISPSFFQSPSRARPQAVAPPVIAPGAYGQVKTIPLAGSLGGLYSSSPQPFAMQLSSLQGGTISQSLQSSFPSSTGSSVPSVGSTSSIMTSPGTGSTFSSYQARVSKGFGTITLADFKTTFTKFDDFYDIVANDMDRDDAFKAQKKMEKSMLQDATPCALASEGGLHGKGPYLNTEEIKKLARNRFYDVNAMKAIACSLDSITYLPEAGGLTAPERIRHWFRGVQQIGEESVEGYAMEGTFGKAYDLFILKAPSSKTGLTHEIIVGMYCTNKMRAFNPNFSYVYGYMKCSPPVIDAKTTEVISYCYGKNDVEYAIYENIADSISMREFSKTCTGKEWLEAYLQVILALLDAHDRFKFTHYDLHPGNVLVQKKLRFDKNETRSGGAAPFQIKYPFRGKDVYLTTSNLARIIDYGVGYFEYMSQSYGRSGSERYSIFRDRSFPMADAYKLLAGCAVTAGPQARVVIEQIFTFFNSKQDMGTALKGQSDYYYSLPYIENKTALWTFGDLLDHIELSCKDYSSILSRDRSIAPLLGCESECLNLSKTIEKIGGYSEEIPYDIFSYYDLLGRSEGAENKGIIADFKKLYPKAEKSFMSKYLDPLVKDIEAETKGISMIDLSTYTYDEITNPKTLKLYVALLIRFINIEDHVKTLEWYVKIGDSTYESQNPSGDKSPYSKYTPLIARYNKIIAEATGILNANDKIIDRHIRDNRLRPNPILRQYRDERNLLRINPK